MCQYYYLFSLVSKDAKKDKWGHKKLGKVRKNFQKVLFLSIIAYFMHIHAPNTNIM